MTNTLTTPHGVLQELEDIRAGLLYFDHLFGRVLDDLHERQSVWNTAESEAAALARADAPKAATATEIKGLITHHVNASPSARKARDELAEAEARKAKIERWVRSLEQRLKAAQSAKGTHDQLMQGGGG